MTIKEFYKDFLKIGKISTDSRELIPGSIFFALKGDNFNGNHFALEAIEKGCSLSVVDEDLAPDDDRIIRVPEVLTFLQDLAAYHRSQYEIPVLAITGTNGKTTSKELIATVLRKKHKVIATKGNLNNHIGVPLTLLDVDESTDVAVVEMGANHKGEISALCKIARPTHGLITNIGRAHLEGFGSPAGVREAKNELYIHLRESKGLVFINDDDQVLNELAQDLPKVSYGKMNTAVVQGQDPGDIFSSVLWKSPPGITDWLKLKSHLVGGYNFYNILAAVCIGNYFGVEQDEINSSIESYLPDLNRSQFLTTNKNRIILDAYNANPDSMNAAIGNFRKYKSDAKIAILGDMFELGDYSPHAHQEVLDKLTESPFCEVLLVGPEFSIAAEGTDSMAFNNLETLVAYLKENPITESLLLLKGSRGMGLEQLLVHL